MAEFTPSDEELRGMLYDVLGDWRTGELTLIRRRIFDIEEKIEALENRKVKPSPNKAALKSQLEEQAAKLVDRKEKKVAMIEEAYRFMLDFVDRREREMA